jgi:hypothetical protein
VWTDKLAFPNPSSHVFQQKVCKRPFFFSLAIIVILRTVIPFTMDQENLLWSFKQDKEGVMDVLGQISPSLVK